MTITEKNTEQKPTYQNVGDAINSVYRGKCMELDNIIKEERAQINNLAFYLKEL